MLSKLRLAITHWSAVFARRFRNNFYLFLAVLLTGAILHSVVNNPALVTIQITCGIAVYSAITWKYNRDGAADLITVITTR